MGICLPRKTHLNWLAHVDAGEPNPPVLYSQILPRSCPDPSQIFPRSSPDLPHILPWTLQGRGGGTPLISMSNLQNQTLAKCESSILDIWGSFWTPLPVWVDLDPGIQRTQRTLLPESTSSTGLKPTQTHARREPG